MEGSYAVCEDLTFGRMSFKGFNPDVEKLMQKLERERNPAPKEDQVLIDDKEADVRAEDVVQRYSLTKTIRNKYATMQHRGGIRGGYRGKHFQRPSDD